MFWSAPTLRNEESIFRTASVELEGGACTNDMFAEVAQPSLKEISNRSTQEAKNIWMLRLEVLRKLMNI